MKNEEILIIEEDNDHDKKKKNKKKSHINGWFYTFIVIDILAIAALFIIALYGSNLSNH